MIKMEKLSFGYKDKVVFEEASIEIEKGKINILLGANGCGKSTFIKLLLGLLKRQSGELYLEGKSIAKERDFKAMRERVGVVMQDPDSQLFFPRVYDELAFTLRNQGLSEEVINETISSTCKTLNLEEYLEKIPYELSYGQKKRVVCASILVGDYDYIIFDEPFVYLDYNGRKAMFRLIKELKKKGITPIIATHNTHYAYEYGDRFIFIRDRGFEVEENRNILKEVKFMESHSLEPIKYL